MPSGDAGGWTAHFTGAVAGTYTYVCQIHQGTQGTIVVAPVAAVIAPPPTSISSVAAAGTTSSMTALLLVLLVAASGLATLGLAARRRNARG